MHVKSEMGWCGVQQRVCIAMLPVQHNVQWDSPSLSQDSPNNIWDKSMYNLGQSKCFQGGVHMYIIWDAPIIYPEQHKNVSALPVFSRWNVRIKVVRIYRVIVKIKFRA